jgi:hypothetical protein
MQRRLHCAALLHVRDGWCVNGHHATSFRTVPPLASCSNVRAMRVGWRIGRNSDGSRALAFRRAMETSRSSLGASARTTLSEPLWIAIAVMPGADGHGPGEAGCSRFSALLTRRWPAYSTVRKRPRSSKLASRRRFGWSSSKSAILSLVARVRRSRPCTRPAVGKGVTCAQSILISQRQDRRHRRGGRPSGGA